MSLLTALSMPSKNQLSRLKCETEGKFRATDLTLEMGSL